MASSGESFALLAAVKGEGGQRYKKSLMWSTLYASIAGRTASGNSVSASGSCVSTSILNDGPTDYYFTLSSSTISFATGRQKEKEGGWQCSGQLCHVG